MECRATVRKFVKDDRRAEAWDGGRPVLVAAVAEACGGSGSTGDICGTVDRMVR